MSFVRRVAGLASRAPTVLRTLRHLQADQARAQLHHVLVGLPKPRPASGAPPTLALLEPHTAFLPPPAHVKSRGKGRVELLATEIDLGTLGEGTDSTGGVDWAVARYGALVAYHLHQHEYARLADWTPSARAALILDWIGRHESGVGWDPHPISLRSICWGKLLTTPGALETDATVREAMLRSLADQIETLAAGLEVRLQANHLLSNLIAVVFGGLLMDGSSSASWRGHADALLEEIDRQIRPDGGHEERSPMYHSLLLENLLDLANLAQAAPERAPDGLVEGLQSAATRMLEALDLYTHPDGRIALFADSALDIAADPAQLRGYATRLGMTAPREPVSGALPQTGYFRLRADEFDLIASVAGPAPRHQPGHAHCDALSFELCVGSERLVTDTGLFEYLPGERRQLARRTASHSTLEFDGREQAEIWAAHRVGGRPEVGLSAWDASGAAEAMCRGWARGAPLHRRFYSVEASGVSVVDRVEGRCRNVCSRLHIDPAWQVELQPLRAIATRTTPDGAALRVEIDLPEAFEWSVERGAYYPTFGVEIERAVIVGHSSGCDEATIRFRRVG